MSGPDSAPAVRPIRRRLTQGRPYDFGTHANDFLVPREAALGTEVFLVRVPGLGAVPPHAHPDMEQTFVFIAGVGTAEVGEGQGRQVADCRPGELLFVPAGWRHTVSAAGPEGLTYLTVNAFVPGAMRDGDTATGHADLAHRGFRARSAAAAHGPGHGHGHGHGHGPERAHADATALSRVLATAFRAADGRMWPESFGAFDASLFVVPDSFRVRRLGPFEFVERVRPRPRVAARDLDFARSAGPPVYLGGSHSPLSLRAPHDESDLNLLLVADTAAEVAAAREAAVTLRRDAPRPVTVEIVARPWLRTPYYYAALDLAPDSPDRAWWQADTAPCLAEAHRRITLGLALIADPAVPARMARQARAWFGGEPGPVTEWRLVPPSPGPRDPTRGW